MSNIQKRKLVGGVNDGSSKRWRYTSRVSSGKIGHIRFSVAKLSYKKFLVWSKALFHCGHGQNVSNSTLYPDVLKIKTNCCQTKIFKKCHFFIYESISGYSVAWMSWQQCGQMMALKIRK